MRLGDVAPSGPFREAKPIDVSVIIVSWNVLAFLRRCIRSIITTKNHAFVEVIVIDNASADGSPDMVRSEFEEAVLLAMDSNLGFGAANNVGLAQARGRYVLFLNPDAMLEEGALTKMIDFLDQEPDFDMVGPRLVSPDGSTQRICARRLPSLTLTLYEALYLHRLPVIGRRLKDRIVSPYDLDQAQEVEAISGAAMFARRSAVDRLGGFDKSFLHTGEDMDLCLRLRQSGARIFYLPDARVLHFGGQSAALASVRTATLGFISMGEYFRRSGGRFHALLYRLIVRSVQMPLLLLVGIGKAISRRSLADLRERAALAKSVWTSDTDR